MTSIDKAIGAGVARLEGVAKVTGAARYAYEHPVADALYVWPVQSTIASGRVVAVRADDALSQAGVVDVLTSANVPRLVASADDPSLSVLQSGEVAYRGQIVAAVVASTLEGAAEAAAAVAVDYEQREHRADLRTDDPRIFAPETVNAGFAGTTQAGDVEAALASAPVRIDATYTTPAEHAAPMEPHATIAIWDDEVLTLYDANQGPWVTASTLAALFDLAPDAVRVVSDHVGGGFGSKAVPRPPVVLAALAARAVGRPEKLALTRQQMFSLVTYRTPSVQRVRLGATADGRLVALAHDALQQSSTLVEYCEQTVTPSRVMYSAPNRRTSHRLAVLDVPPPSWMRAPGEAPGMFALESAMDELGCALGMDPVQLRIVNEPDVEPETGLPFSSRNLVACLREGAERFGWAARDSRPRSRREGDWWIGSGVAAGNYPVYMAPATATAQARADGTFVVRIAAVDIGTGSRTALTQVAADALGAPLERVTVEVGSSVLPSAPFAGGSLGMASWGWAVTRACEALNAELGARDGAVPSRGLEVLADTTEELEAAKERSRHSFGAQFAQVRVDAHTGEVRVDRLLGVFAAGRIVNARTARSQLVGAMVMGISMALHEGLELDPRFGDFANHDFASYHIAANADIPAIEAHWIEERDSALNPLGVKGIGELGIVGTAAAIANAVHHATGTRVRDLPITMERVSR
jgi:xanthine dehydrogenase YagR molybdenum-binding subunit